MTEKKGRGKSAADWFSTDSLLGKALCILLVIILTVAAFLAPKLINNLYDAGTLMQITYVDMDLSPYAVSYVSFEDKLKAIARAKTRGDYFVTLSADEADEKISDAELVQAVNREMEAASDGLGWLFYENWWGELSEGNLVARERNAIYVQQTAGADSRQETAPIQFWKLTFSAADVEEEPVYDWEDMTEEERKAVLREKSVVSGYITDRLIVCMDTDFYKIYAVAVEGERDEIQALGLNLEDLFGTASQGKEGGNRYVDPDLGMYMTDQIVECWAAYWDAAPEDKNIYMNIPGEISGCLAFREDGAREEKENSSGTENVFVNLSTDNDVESAVGENAGDIVYMGNSIDENEILLEVGSFGGWDETDAGRWIQKTGCRDFFDMMQF